jgi:hypothetical protein
MTQSERRDKFAETHQVATALINSQRALRDAKTARLRAMRLAAEADEAATRTGSSSPIKE